MFLYTIGYEGLSIDEFINKLNNSKIDTIIDVRELAQSRKSGFSKKSLRNILEMNKINYYHFNELGSPKELRRGLHEKRVDYNDFFQAYRIHITKYIDTINKALDIVESSSSALLCFEHNPKECHRSILADVMVSYSNKHVEVKNL